MKYTKGIAVCVVAFLMIATMAAFASGQSVNEVSGYIRDSSNNSPISDARVDVQNNAGAEHYTAYSDGNGHYSIDLPPGDYHVTVTRNDYQNWETDFTMGTMPEARDIYLDPENGGGDTGGDSEDGGFEMPFGDIDEDSIMTIVMIMVALIVTFFICLITITIALMVISSRLGKIRKELVALNEAQKPNAPTQAAPQYQQPPPPPTE